MYISLEIHEVFRKLVLMGVLIFLPPKTRSASAILICVIACCSLNFFQPHRNRIVLGMAQLSFLLSTFKYIVAVLIGPGTDMTSNDQELLGYLMVVLDVIFMVGSISCMFIVVYLLRSSFKKVHQKEKKLKALNATAVTPISKKKTASMNMQGASIDTDKAARLSAVMQDGETVDHV